MRLLHKRILIMFSVALNIGFVIMALGMFFHHGHRGKSHKYSDVIDIVHRLDLPEAQEDKAMECVRQFRIAIEKQEKEIRLALDNIIRLAGKSGPLDQERLHQLYEAVNQEEIRKNKLIEAHVIEMRTLLEDEKGVQFYSLLLEHLKNKNKDKSRHR